MPDHADILRRLEAASGPIHDPFEREWFVDAAHLEDGEDRQLLRDALSPSRIAIGSAIGLVERMLPGAVWHIMTDYGDLNRAKIGPAGRPSASIYNCAERPEFTVADGETPPLAILIALFRALEAGK